MERISALDTLSVAAAPIACIARTVSKNGKLRATKQRMVDNRNVSCPYWYRRRNPMRLPRAEKGSNVMTSVN